MILRVESCEPPAVIPQNADETLPSLRFVLATGNACVVTASKKDTGAGMCNMTINYAWIRPPSYAEELAVKSIVRNVLHTEPAAHHECADAAAAAKWQEEFLEGK
jgi:hypothetical protein